VSVPAHKALMGMMSIRCCIAILYSLKYAYRTAVHTIDLQINCHLKLVNVIIHSCKRYVYRDVDHYVFKNRKKADLSRFYFIIILQTYLHMYVFLFNILIPKIYMYMVHMKGFVNSSGILSSKFCINRSYNYVHT